MNSENLGFIYTVEHIRNGEVLSSETIHNVMPDEGSNYFLSAALLGGSQSGTWYVGVFEGDYTPVASDTAATFPGAAYGNECVAYTEATREQWFNDAIAGGLIINGTTRAEFTFNATKIIRGAFLTNLSTKGGTTGVLLSAARFLSPKNVDATDILRVVAGISVINL